MRLADRLLDAFPEPPPDLDRAIDAAFLAELMPDQPMRVKHIMGVCTYGQEVAAGLAASPALARQIDEVTLAHDIGYAGRLNRLGFHPLDGAVYLAHRGAEEAVIHAVLHHSGAREGAMAVPSAWPFYRALDPFEPTLLSDIITFCDTQTSPRGERVTIAERIGEVESRYGVDSPTGRSMRAMQPEFDDIHRRMSVRLVGVRPHEPGYRPGILR